MEVWIQWVNNSVWHQININESIKDQTFIQLQYDRDTGKLTTRFSSGISDVISIDVIMYIGNS